MGTTRHNRHLCTPSLCHRDTVLLEQRGLSRCWCRLCHICSPGLLLVDPAALSLCQRGCRRVWEGASIPDWAPRALGTAKSSAAASGASRQPLTCAPTEPCSPGARETPSPPAGREGLRAKGEPAQRCAVSCHAGESREPRTAKCRGRCLPCLGKCRIFREKDKPKTKA